MLQREPAENRSKKPLRNGCKASANQSVGNPNYAKLVVHHAMRSRPMALWEYSHKHIAPLSTAPDARKPMLDRMWPFRRNPSNRIRSSSPYWLLRDGMGDVFGSIGRGIEHDHPRRIAMLPGHQIADCGLIVGAVEIGLDERRAMSAEMIDDECNNRRRHPEQSRAIYA